MLESIVINPSIFAEHTIIWCHGLDSSGHDYVSFVKKLQALVPLPIRFILPHAEMRIITVNKERTMRAWHDVIGFGLNAPEDREGLEATASDIDHLIQQQIAAGIPAENILLGGFSQGAAAILYAGLHYPQKLGGLISFSGYLPFCKALKHEKKPINQQIPIFWSHGMRDNIILYSWAEFFISVLKNMQYDVEFNSCQTSHFISEEQTIALSTWIKEKFDFL